MSIYEVKVKVGKGQAAAKRFSILQAGKDANEAEVKAHWFFQNLFPDKMIKAFKANSIINTK